MNLPEDPMQYAKVWFVATLIMAALYITASVIVTHF